MDVRAEIAAERLDLIEVLDGLPDDGWSTPSLCADWSVRDVVAHLVTPYLERPTRTALDMVRLRSIGGAMRASAARVAAHTNSELVDALQTNLDVVFVPPLLGMAAPLTDAIVHGADIRVPLGLEWDRPAGRVVRSLRFATSTRAVPMFRPLGRLRGLRLAATDASWSSGDGELVTGPATDLLMAVLGRRWASHRLAGPGVELLAARSG